jgi:hypothetical protein
MKRRFRQRRFVVFACVLLLLTGSLVGAMIVSVNRQMRVSQWTSQLGANERASLLQAALPHPEDPADDPMLAIPELSIEPGQRIRTGENPYIVYQARMTARVVDMELSPLDLVAKRLERDGPSTDARGRTNLVKNPQGDLYMVRWIIRIRPRSSSGIS